MGHTFLIKSWATAIVLIMSLQTNAAVMRDSIKRIRTTIRP